MRASLLISAFAVVLAGCGGTSTGTAPGTYAGDYAGTVELDGTKSGALALEVDQRGIARGTFAVTDPGSSRAYSFPLGTFSVLGSAGGDGSFSATGENGVGRFVVSGRFPQSPRGALLVVSAGGEGFQGRFADDDGPGPIGTALTFAGTAGSNVSARVSVQ